MDFLQLTISGVANGCKGLIAALRGHKATEAVNFAQGDFMMLGAFVCIGFTNHEYMGRISGWLSRCPFW